MDTSRVAASLRWSLVLAVCAWLASAAAAQELPAFPGAEGFGSATPGGRGGAVYVVTTLEDYGPADQPIEGSLRAAVEAEEPRMVVFRVAGTIELKQDLQIDEPFITIAGQSAPGEGITLKDKPLQIETHDVVVRHLRVRLGDQSGGDDDAIWVEGARNVVLDHVSASWSIDETLSVTGSDSVTVQWSFITESLNDSHHAKGEHGYGSLLNAWDGAYSFHHNLYAHHRSRNPRPQGVEGMPGLLLDFRNNVIYDWQDRAGYTKGNEPVRMNHVHNYLRPGPSTSTGASLFAFVIEDNYAAYDVEGTVQLYVEGNVVDAYPALEDDQWSMVLNAFENDQFDAPFDVAAVATDDAADAYERVLAEAGASLPARDAVDLRIVEQVVDGTGGIIDSQDDVGGWPALEAGEAPADGDSDGMPNAWELEHGLDPADGTDHSGDADGDGYTNIEEHLNGTDPQLAATAREEPGSGAVAGLGSYPHPFRGSATLEYTVGDAGPVTVTLWDGLGRKVRVLEDGFHQAGTHRRTISASDLAAGVYVVTMQTREATYTHGIIRVR